MKRTLHILLLGGHFLCLSPLTAQSVVEAQWVDSVYQSLTERQRLAQLLMIRAHSDLGEDHIAAVEDQIREQGVGGLCFFQGTPEKQLELINAYQDMSRLPLLVSIDGEWGLGMRMRATTMSFPRQLQLGAIQDNDLIYEMGAEIARQLRRVGIQVNFAPVADINNNPANPVINTRSFGEDRYNVAAKCYQYLRGMQDHGVMACAKHFPGHGDTDVDSHLDLPLIPYTRKRLDSLELYPFRLLADSGVGSFMVAHLQVPALDTGRNRPTTLSRATVTGILREAWQYEGLIFTDAMEMKGVAKYFAPGRAEVEALRAGNDILLLPAPSALVLDSLQAAMNSGMLDSARVASSVRRILHAKFRLGLSGWQALSTKGLSQDLHTGSARMLLDQLHEASLTWLGQGQAWKPIKADARIAVLRIGAAGSSALEKSLGLHAKLRAFHLTPEWRDAEWARLRTSLEQFDRVLVTVRGMNNRPADDYGLDRELLNRLQDLDPKGSMVIWFGNPYGLAWVRPGVPVLLAYEDSQAAHRAVLRALLGKIGVSGRLPVTASPEWRYGQGDQVPPSSP